MFNPDRTSWWLPSIGRQCLQVKTNELVINETTDNVSNFIIRYCLELTR